MSLWVKQYRSGVIPFFTDPAGEKLAAPLLWIDSIAEMLGAVLAFFVVRQVLTRRSHPWANWLALLSALLLWFDPTVFVDRVWPQWDSWLLPFFLAAALCALNRLWLLTGICLGVGMMFKGQILCTGAMFVFWPLFQGRWREAVDVIVGALLGLTLCVSPWLIRTPLAAVLIVILLIAAGLALRLIPRDWRIPYVGASIVLAAFLSGKSSTEVSAGGGSPSLTARITLWNWQWGPQITSPRYSKNDGNFNYAIPSFPSENCT